MRRGKTIRRIVLPQATQAMIPSFINQSIMQLKNTSLVSVVAVADLVYQGRSSRVSYGRSRPTPRSPCSISSSCSR